MIEFKDTEETPLCFLSNMGGVHYNASRRACCDVLCTAYNKKKKDCEGLILIRSITANFTPFNSLPIPKEDT